MSWQWRWFRGRQYSWSSDGSGGGGGGGLPWLFYALFIGVGLVFLVVGLVVLFNTRAFVKDALTAPGTVVGYQTRRDDEGSLLYYAVVRYTTAEGREVEIEGGTGSSYRPYREGAQVKVLYRPAEPELGQISSFMELWFLPAMFIGFGVLFPAIGTAVWCATHRRPPAAPPLSLPPEPPVYPAGGPPLA